MIETHFIVVFQNDWRQNHYWFSIKSMTPTFVVVVADLLPICSHIGWGMPNLRFFVEEVVTVLGAITEKWV